MSFNKICKYCGSVENYRTEMKNNQNTAWCLDCGKYMGNEPYSNKKPMLYFGKYKEKPIEDFETPDEINYLKWIKNVSGIELKPDVISAIERKID